MRPLLVPVTGTTDGNGAATLRIALPQSDEWHAGKIVLSTAAPASWAVTLGGSPVNFGEGRRVTLGPELMQPLDQLAVNVVAGPANAPIIGTLAGISGTMEEALAHYSPTSNTIAVNVAAARININTQIVKAAAAGGAPRRGGPPPPHPQPTPASSAWPTPFSWSSRAAAPSAASSSRSRPSRTRMGPGP
jgi:hypothetical protein